MGLASERSVNICAKWLLQIEGLGHNWITQHKVLSSRSRCYLILSLQVFNFQALELPQVRFGTEYIIIFILC